MCETYEFIPFSDKIVKEPDIDIYNAFKGFNYKYKDNVKIDDKKIFYILHHLEKVLCAGNSKNYDYLIKWLAWLVQNPDKKTGVCCVFISDQGTGKNMFFEWYGKRIIGNSYYHYINNINNLTNRFNSDIANKIFTILDEVQIYEISKTKADQLKSIITQNDIRLERKGMEPKILDDYNNYVMFTNNSNPITLDSSDRRYAFFDVSNCYRTNNDYYTKLYNNLYNKEAEEIFYHYLLNIELNNFNPERDIPKNKLKTNMKIDSSNLTTKYLIHVTRIDGLEQSYADILPDLSNNPEICEVNKSYESFKTWCDKYQPKGKIPSLNVFSRQLSSVLSKSRKIDGKKIYKLNKKILSLSLCKFFGVDNIEDLYDEVFSYDSGYDSEDTDEVTYPLPVPIIQNKNYEKDEICEIYENINNVNNIIDEINVEIMEENIITPINEKENKYKCKINGKN